MSTFNFIFIVENITFLGSTLAFVTLLGDVPDTNDFVTTDCAMAAFTDYSSELPACAHAEKLTRTIGSGRIGDTVLVLQMANSRR